MQRYFNLEGLDFSIENSNANINRDEQLARKNPPRYSFKNDWSSDRFSAKIASNGSALTSKIS